MKVVSLDNLAEELGLWGRTFLEEAKAAVMRGIQRSIPELVKASPVDTGLYAQSWDAEFTETGAMVGNTAPHAPIIEYGARPFRPPLKPLLEWAKRVLKDESQPPNYSREVRALAIGVQRKIMQQGIAPRHILENALPMILENIRKELESLG